MWCDPICQFLLLFPELLKFCSESSCLHLYLHVFSLVVSNSRSYIKDLWSILNGYLYWGKR
jgi:hypothetical protein